MLVQMKDYIMTALALAMIASIWWWLFTPKRTFGDMSVTVSLLLFGLCILLQIIFPELR